MLSNEATVHRLSVYLGKTAINDTDTHKEQSFGVEKVVMHPDFDENSFNNDIGEHTPHTI